MINITDVVWLGHVVSVMILEWVVITYQWSCSAYGHSCHLSVIMYYNPDVVLTYHWLRYILLYPVGVYAFMNHSCTCLSPYKCFFYLVGRNNEKSEASKYCSIHGCCYWTPKPINSHRILVEVLVCISVILWHNGTSPTWLIPWHDTFVSLQR
jgi:hypothetical protein